MGAALAASLRAEQRLLVREPADARVPGGRARAGGCGTTTTTTAATTTTTKTTTTTSGCGAGLLHVLPDRHQPRCPPPAEPVIISTPVWVFWMFLGERAHADFEFWVGSNSTDQPTARPQDSLVRRQRRHLPSAASPLAAYILAPLPPARRPPVFSSAHDAVTRCRHTMVSPRRPNGNGNVGHDSMGVGGSRSWWWGRGRRLQLQLLPMDNPYAAVS